MVKPMHERDAVIFDIDGVLVDSYEAHYRSWHRLAVENGRAYSEAEFAKGFGRTSREIIAETWGDMSLTDDQVRQLDERKEAIYRDLIQHDFPAMPGARGLIRALHDAGFLLAVGSSGPPENVDLAVELLGITPLLQAMVSGRDVTKGKPHPEVFLKAAERMRADPERCIVIEDAAAGVQAAHAGGMKCVGLVSTGRTPDELAAADLVIARLDQLSPTKLRSLIYH